MKAPEKWNSNYSSTELRFLEVIHAASVNHNKIITKMFIWQNKCLR